MTNQAKVALEQAKEALDSVWAAIGDALCSGKGIEKAYANSVAAQCRAATAKIESALSSLPEPNKHPAMRALESLTPGGSEFVDDIEACIAHVKARQRSLMEQLRKRVSLPEQAGALMEISEWFYQWWFDEIEDAHFFNLMQKYFSVEPYRKYADSHAKGPRAGKHEASTAPSLAAGESAAQGEGK